MGGRKGSGGRSEGLYDNKAGDDKDMDEGRRHSCIKRILGKIKGKGCLPGIGHYRSGGGGRGTP